MLLSIVTVPIFIETMGVEAYGLIAFYSMAQTWFLLLDLGITPAVTRETISLRAGTVERSTYRKTFLSVQSIIILMACLLGLSAETISTAIAESWLSEPTVPGQDVKTAMYLMIFCLIGRWVSGIYRGVMLGHEAHFHIAFINAFFASLKFLAIIPILIHVSNELGVFFKIQLAITTLELFVVAAIANHRLPFSIIDFFLDGRSLSGIGRFSLTLAFTSSIWIIISNVDKLILSGMLSLQSYAEFAVGVSVASVITLLHLPCATILAPHMAMLYQQKSSAAFRPIISLATQAFCCVSIPLIVLAGVFGEWLLLLWLDDSVLAKAGAGVLTLYSIGNFFLALSAYGYYLQYAEGNLNLHLKGNVIFIMVLIPTIYVAATMRGSQGAAFAWMFTNALYFLVWMPVTFKYYLPGFFRAWLLRDIVPYIAISLTSLGILSFSLLALTDLKLINQAIFVSIGLLSFSLGMFAIRNGRRLFAVVS